MVPYSYNVCQDRFGTRIIHLGLHHCLYQVGGKKKFPLFEQFKKSLMICALTVQVKRAEKDENKHNN